MARTLLYRTLIQALRKARMEDPAQPHRQRHPDKEKTAWTRRQFLYASAAVGAAGLLGNGLVPSSAFAAVSSSARNMKIAVIGAGIAGLNAAYHLKKAGLAVTVYEASNRLGGRIFTRTGAVGDGVVTEMGAEFINTDHYDMLSLASEFNLELFNHVKDAESLDIPTSGYFFEGRVWTEAEIADQLLSKLYYGHFMCHVLHQDYIVKKGADPKALKDAMLALLDTRGAEYPAEHNVGRSEGTGCRVVEV